MINSPNNGAYKKVPISSLGSLTSATETQVFTQGIHSNVLTSHHTITSTSNLAVISESRSNTNIDRAVIEVVGVGEPPVPPVISGVNVAVTPVSATVNWQTDVIATSRVDYGLTNTYDATASSAAAVTSHQLTLVGLVCNTTYHYQITSAASPSGATGISTDATFTTAACTPDGNVPPTANAGSDQSVTSPDGAPVSIVLDGSGSTDPDGVIAAWSWSSDTGLAAEGASPTLAVPVGVHTFTLAVTDDGGGNDTDTIVVTVLDATAPDPLSVMFGAVADATVDGSLPDRNFGGTAILEADGGNPSVEAVTRFDVSGVTGQVVSARLRLYAYNGSTDGPEVFSTDTSWTEWSVTWNNRPDRIGAPLVDLGAVPIGWVEIDVSQAVTGDGSYSFLFSQVSTNATKFDSRETTRPPELVISYQPDGNVPPTANAGSDQSVTSPDGAPVSIVLDGSGSTDPDGVIAAWSWSSDTGLAAEGASPTLAVPVGVHTFTLAVTDDGGGNDTDTIVVTVLDATAPDPLSVMFGAVADATVDGSLPDRNFGGTAILEADGGNPSVEAVTRFDVSGVTGQVVSAMLRLYAYNGSTDGPEVFSTDTSWTEWSVTWNNRPDRIGAPLVDLGAVPIGWVEIDVSQAVTGDGSYSFLFSQVSTNATKFDSRETTRPPELVISYQPDGNVPPTANAGSDQSVTSPDGAPVSIVLDGSGSTDPDGVIAAWSWSSDTGLAAEGASPTLAVPVGVHTFTLAVTDDGGGNDTDTIVVTVLDATAPDPLSVPPVPSGLAVGVVSATELAVSWTDVAGETSYQLEVGPSAGPFVAVAGSPLAAGTVSYPASGLTTEVEYCFRVEASNAAGPSGFTTPVCATPVTGGSVVVRIEDSDPAMVVLVGLEDEDVVATFGRFVDEVGDQGRFSERSIPGYDGSGVEHDRPDAR